MVTRAIVGCLLLLWLCGCAEIVGIEDDSYLVGGQGGFGDLAAAQPEAGADARPPTSPGQEASAPVGYGPWCGNDSCDWSEDKDSCPGDCPAYSCGNHACEAGEDLSSCGVDCGEPAVCGDTKCEPIAGEKAYNCPDDCSR